MADGAKWIQITTDVFDNWKIKSIKSIPEMGHSLVCVWFELLCLAGKCNHPNGLIVMSEKFVITDQLIADIFNEDIKLVQVALKTFQDLGMIQVTDDSEIKITNWLEYQNAAGLDLIRSYEASRKAKYRDKKNTLIEQKDNVPDKSGKCPCVSSISISLSNIDIYKSLDIDSEVKQYIAENDVFANAIIDWLAYKDEKKPKKENHYTAAGMKKWIKQMYNGCKEYGVQPVVDAINYAIAHEWKGVYFDNLKKNKPSGIEGIENW